MKRNHLGYRVGECHQKEKLSDADVAKMRRMYRPGIVGMPTLAREFGCGLSTVRDIVTYRTRPA
jgi:hypothetical protein